MDRLASFVDECLYFSTYTSGNPPISSFEKKFCLTKIFPSNTYPSILDSAEVHEDTAASCCSHRVCCDRQEGARATGCSPS